MVDYYKATGDSGHTLYAKTSNNVYCQIHHPSGHVGEVSRLLDDWPIERVTGQLNAKQVGADSISGLFSVKARILDTLEQADGELSTSEIHDSNDTDSPNTTYGALKHLAWDGLIERASGNPDTWTIK